MTGGGGKRHFSILQVITKLISNRLKCKKKNCFNPLKVLDENKGESFNTLEMGKTFQK